MKLKNKVATVFGGTGFIGRYVVEQLAREGATIKVVTRFPSSAYFLRTAGNVGQIVPVFCHFSAEAIDRAVQGSDIVVNCLGILNQRGKSTFKRVHVEIAQQIAQSCAVHNVERLVHISALGADQAQSKYAKTKHEGEDAVKAAFPSATILRPSVVFGPEDNFFNKFAKLCRISPVLPLVAGGHTKLQPVYVGDVATAVTRVLTTSEFGVQSPLGQAYDIGGPEVVDFKGVYQKLFAHTRRKRCVVNLPTLLARLQALFFAVLPNPPLTNDQITTLKTDAVVRHDALSLKDLGIEPTAMDVVLPLYLDHFVSGGKFAEKKRA